MSIVALKKKSAILFGGAHLSGKPPGGYWLPQGPFGANPLRLNLAIHSYGPEGFSLNGGTRNIGYVGKTMHMSKQGTRFRGQYPYGNGGFAGTYATPLPSFNVNETIVLSDQYKYIKPTVLTTYGMLAKKYRWIRGQYPNVWVQPNYTGNLTDTASQGAYLSQLAAANVCVTDVNAESKYVDNIRKCGPTLCKKSAARFKFNDMASNGQYVKFIKNPQDSSMYTLQIQQQCANPSPAQKPFPFAVNGNVCNAAIPQLRV